MNDKNKMAHTTAILCWVVSTMFSTYSVFGGVDIGTRFLFLFISCILLWMGFDAWGES